ncbi:hypothetical protein ACLKA7_007918 [Drosophila subpalustris]
MRSGHPADHAESNLATFELRKALDKLNANDPYRGTKKQTLRKLHLMERFKPFNLATDAETADTLSYSGVSAVPEAVITLNDDKEVVLQIQHLNIAAMMGK